MSIPAMPAPVKASPPAWPVRGVRTLSGHAVLCLLVQACLAQIVPNAAAIAAGSRDPEHVHQLRVGVRRLRGAVREMPGAAASLPGGWATAMHGVFEAAGVERDRHVLRTTLAPLLRRAGAPLWMPQGSDDDDAAVVDLARRVAAGDFQKALRRLQAWAHADADADAGAGVGDRDDDRGKPALGALRTRLDRLSRRILKDADRFESLAFVEQHRARKRLKRLRYLADMLAPLFAPRSVRRWTRAARRAQDSLGRCIDEGLALQRFEVTASHDPRAWFAVGWLRARIGHNARRAQRRLRRLRRIDPFW